MIHTDTKEARVRILQRLLKGDASGLELRNDLAAWCRPEAVRRAIDWAHRCGYIAPAGFEGRSYRWKLTEAGKAKAAPNQRRLTITIDGDLSAGNVGKALNHVMAAIKFPTSKGGEGGGDFEALHYEYTLEVMP